MHRRRRRPRVLVDLVDKGWRDLLVLTHVKEGADSTAWREHLSTLEQLNRWLSQHEQGDAGDDLVMERGLEAGTLIDMIGQQLATALPTNVAHQPVLQELSEIVAGEREVELVDRSAAAASAPEPAEIRARIEDLPGCAAGSSGWSNLRRTAGSPTGTRRVAR